jgi:hypothetical protein
VTTVGDPLPPPDQRSAPAARGRLIITNRAAQHVVEGAAVRTSLGITDVDVDITDVTDNGIVARITVAAHYPNGALSHALTEFRRTVAADVSRLVGRPMRRLDVIVKDLTIDVPNGRRVQ